MSLTITGRHLEVTPAIHEYVQAKTARVMRHFDQVIDSQVLLSIQGPKQHTAEITMRVPGKDLHCEATGENLYGAIDVLIDKLDRLVIKYKTKGQANMHEAHKRQAIETE